MKTTGKAGTNHEDVVGRVVESLCAASEGPCGWMRSGPGPSGQPLPSRDAVIRIVEDLRGVLFPGYFGPQDLTHENLRFQVGATLGKVQETLKKQILCAMCFACEREGKCDLAECEKRAGDKAGEFVAGLPRVRRLLAIDVQAAYEGDPAATSPDETILCYPGMLAITSYRLAHALSGLEVPLLPRIITEHAHSITGIDIHPGAKIEGGFFIDHGTGVVIGETCEIGKRVRLYQGVTLGAKSFPLDENGNPIKGIPRHPIVEDDVIIYAGATILGRVTIGKGSSIGGNVWLTKGVPPGSTITQARAK